MSHKPIVFDTNCWISYFLQPNGTPAKAIEAALSQYTVVHSPETLQELRTVISRPRFDTLAPLETRLAFVNTVAASGMAVQPVYQFQAFPDPTDNKFFDLAYSADARYLISGDEKHVLPLKHYHGIETLSPAQFLERELEREKAQELKIDPTPSIWPDYSQGMELKRKPGEEGS
jgi:putative PIN family toxin of toxin-antitoxin system